MQVHKFTNVTGPGTPVRRQSPVIRDPNSGGATRLYAGDAVTYSEIDYEALPEVTRKQLELLVAMEVLSHTVEGLSRPVAAAPPTKLPVAATEPVPAPHPGVVSSRPARESLLPDEELAAEELAAKEPAEKEAPIQKSVGASPYRKALDRGVKKAQLYIIREFGKEPYEDDVVALLETEKANRNRKSVIAWLEELLSKAPTREEPATEEPTEAESEPLVAEDLPTGGEAIADQEPPLGADAVGTFDYDGFLDQTLSNIIIAYEGLDEKLDIQQLIASERGGKNRSVVLNWLGSLS